MHGSGPTDDAVAAYLAAQGSDEIEELGRLLELRAAPMVRKVVFRRISQPRPDAEDVCADAILDLMVRLQRYKQEESAEPIRDFLKYAAAAAHHACDRYWRRKNPAFWHLRNRVRYLIEQDSKLAVWRNSEDVALCGLAIWQSRERAEPVPAADRFAAGKNLRLPELLFQIFQASEGPLELHAMVELVRALSGIGPRLAVESDTIEQLPDSRLSIDREIEQRTYAGELWKEIQDLPRRQRQALLLNLKDDALNLLILRGVASFRDIARTLEMEPEDLARLWNQLPLEDAMTAQRLGCARQQVINLRMAARKRLANRLAGWR